MKYEHLNKVNLVGSFVIALSFVLTVTLSALDAPYGAVHTASVIVSISSLLWAGCAMFILLTHDPERELTSPVVDQ